MVNGLLTDPRYESAERHAVRSKQFKAKAEARFYKSQLQQSEPRDALRHALRVVNKDGRSVR